MPSIPRLNPRRPGAPWQKPQRISAGQQCAATPRIQSEHVPRLACFAELHTRQRTQCSRFSGRSGCFRAEPRLLHSSQVLRQSPASSPASLRQFSRHGLSLRTAPLQWPQAAAELVSAMHGAITSGLASARQQMTQCPRHHPATPSAAQRRVLPPRILAGNHPGRLIQRLGTAQPGPHVMGDTTRSRNGVLDQRQLLVELRPRKTTRPSPDGRHRKRRQLQCVPMLWPRAVAQLVLPRPPNREAQVLQTAPSLRATFSQSVMNQLTSIATVPGIVRDSLPRSQALAVAIPQEQRRQALEG